MTAHKEMYMCVGLMCCIIHSITATQSESIRNLALSTDGAICHVGTYSPVIDTTCSPAIDGLYHRYGTPRGNGWIQVTLPSMARVTMVDLTVVRRDVKRPIPIRIIFNHRQYKVILLKQPHDFVQESYRQRVVLDAPVITKAVTLAWTESNMPAIVDISIFGSTEGITEIAASVASCVGSLSMCRVATDDNMLTSYYLPDNTSLQMALQSRQGLSYAVFYSHPHSTSSQSVPISIDMQDSTGDIRGTIGLTYENQGWDSAATWQIVSLSAYRLSPAWLTIRSSQRAVILSEIHFYHVDSSIEVSPWEVPYVQLLPDEDQYIFNCEPKYFGEIFGTAPHTSTQSPPNVTRLNVMTPSTTGTVHYDNNSEESTTYSLAYNKTENNLYTTRSHIVDEFTVVVPNEYIADDNTDQLPDQDTLPGTDEEYSYDGVSLPIFDAFNATNNSTTHVFLGINWATLPWYWYALVAVGVFTLILVIIIVVMMIRMKKRRYSPNPRPRIVLRSVRLSSGGDGDAVSVVTPTRGYYHLTLNSQSSMPLPYAGLSAGNTTTFGLKKKTEKDGTNCQIYRYEPNENCERGDMYNDDLELSDDCFKP